MTCKYGKDNIYWHHEKSDENKTSLSIIIPND